MKDKHARSKVVCAVCLPNLEGAAIGGLGGGGAGTAACASSAVRVSDETGRVGADQGAGTADVDGRQGCQQAAAYIQEYGVGHSCIDRLNVVANLARNNVLDS